MREPIDFEDFRDLPKLFYKMSEGNPGALRVLLDLFRMPGGSGALLALEDMNMRGPQIWVAYKDHCHEEMRALMECIQERSKAMIDAVNAECTYGVAGGELAVQSRSGTWP